MKTTVELPDALVAQAREVARLEGTSLRDLVTAGLRAEVEARRAGGKIRRFSFPTAGGSGWQSGIDPGALHEYAYDAPSPG